MQEVVTTIGLPASGKTSWTRQEMAGMPGKFININRDDLRMSLFNLAKYSDYKFSKEKEKIVTEMARAIFHHAVCDLKKSVIISDTNLNPAVRQYWEDQAKFYKIKYREQKFLDVSLDELVKRDAQRERSVGYKVIKDMYNTYIDYIDPIEKAPAYNPELKDAIIIDIDGTIANHEGVRSPFDWKQVGLDKPHDDIIQLIKLVMKSNKDLIPLFVSGRDGSCEAETYHWIIKHFYCGDETLNLPTLIMRQAGDSRKDFIVKYEIYNDCIRNEYNIKYVFDDRNQVVNMWRRLGLRTLQVANGDF